MSHNAKVLAFNALTEQDGVWVCPGCGCGWDRGDGLIIDESYCEEPDCSLTHPTDICRCEKCGWSGTARQVVNAAKRRLSMVPCECCGGTGWVKQ